MLQEERFVKIIEYLKANSSARYAELTGILDVSENTVRKDLAELDRRGVIKSVRGGAVWGKNDLAKGVFETRININKKEKEELVSSLGNFLENGQAVALNGGTTSIEVAKYLKQNYSRMTVVTNHLTVADVLKEKKDFRVILASGNYNRTENTIVGSRAEISISQYNTDYAILAVNSISVEKGITDFREEELGIIDAMMTNANRVIIAADHTKFNRVSCMQVCPLDKVDYIITDNNIDEKTLAQYSNRGCRMLTPGIINSIERIT